MRVKLLSLTVVFALVLYLYLLNFFSNGFEGFLYALGGALALAFVMMLFEKLPSILFKIILSIFILLASISIFFKANYNVVITDSILISAFVNKIDLSQEMISVSLIIWLILQQFCQLF